MSASAGSGARVSSADQISRRISTWPHRGGSGRIGIIRPSSGFVYSIAAIVDRQLGAAVSWGQAVDEREPKVTSSRVRVSRPKVSHLFAFSHLKSSPSFGMLHGAASIIFLGTGAPRRTVPPPRLLLCAQHAQAFLFPDRPCVNSFMTKRIVNQTRNSGRRLPRIVGNCRPGDPEWPVSWQHVRSAMI